MKAIEQNPYRILGLLVGATVKEQNKQTNRLSKFVEAEQVPDDDFSFPLLGKFKRTLADIDDATAKLDSDADKINAALFWFYKGNEITDEPAFDALKEGDMQTAKDIWEKLIIETREDGSRFWREVTQRNYSAFHNWFVLGFFENENLSLTTNIKFLESDYWTDFKEKVTDSTFKITRKELQLQFLNTILQEIENNTVEFSLNDFVKTVKNLNFSAKEDFLKTISQKFIAKITAAIEDARKQRKANNTNAAKAGEALYKQAKNDLTQMKSIAQDFVYSSNSDKVADEILQCGIDYFNHYKGSNTDPSRVSMDLFIKAKEFAIGEYAKQRCQENTEGLQEWIDDKPEREKQNKIEKDLKSLVQLWDEFENKWVSIANAKSLINQAKIYLGTIKNVLGTNDSIYLQLSTRTASQAQSYIIDEVNKVQESVMSELQLSHSQYNKNQAISRMKLILKEAWEATELLGSLDMGRDFQINRYAPNKSSLKNLCDQLEVNTYQTPSSFKPSTSVQKFSTPTYKTHTPHPPSKKEPRVNGGITGTLATIGVFGGIIAGANIMLNFVDPSLLSFLLIIGCGGLGCGLGIWIGDFIEKGINDF